MYEHYHEKFIEECFIRNRSAGTTEQYWSAIMTFMKWCNYKPMEELTIQDARNYILSKRRNGAKSETCNFCNSAIAFLFRHVLHKGWDEELVPRMKVDHELPTVYSLEEIQHLIDTARTIRNKAIIALLYSSGLRVGELCNLHAEDIYASKMMVYVRNTKNHCDRWTILSEEALKLLTEYWHSYPVKRDIFFVGEKAPHAPLQPSGVEIMLRKVGADAGLNGIHPHSLRHCFATHLMENGVSTLEIQSLLGHNTFHATNVYLHVVNVNLMGIRSPLDAHKPKKKGKKKKHED